jgi:hypothetical protein
LHPQLPAPPTFLFPHPCLFLPLPPDTFSVLAINCAIKASAMLPRSPPSTFRTQTSLIIIIRAIITSPARGGGRQPRQHLPTY